MAKGAILGQEQVKEEYPRLYFVGSNTLQDYIEVPNIIGKIMPSAIVIKLSDIKINYIGEIKFNVFGNTILALNTSTTDIKELKNFQTVIPINSIEIIEKDTLTCLINIIEYNFGNTRFSNYYDKRSLYPGSLGVKAWGGNSTELPKDEVTGKYEIYFQY